MVCLHIQYPFPHLYSSTGKVSDLQVLRPLVYKEDSGSIDRGCSVLVFLKIKQNRKKSKQTKNQLYFYPKWKQTAFS